MKKLVTYLIQTVSVLVMMLAFACGTIAFAELGYSALLVFSFGYAFAFSKHVCNLYSFMRLGHAFLWVSDRLIGWWLLD